MTINGNFNLTNSGTSVLDIPAGVTIRVTGNMGDPNNNSMTYDVDGILIVDGTLSGKNSVGFIGNGTVAGGTLDVQNNATCGSPCPVTGNFDVCVSGQSFCTNVLPIRLLNFSVEARSEKVLLNWSTTMEEDFSKFVIQRSHDGKNFEDIGEVPGTGFDIYDIESKYTFEDGAPLLGQNYYRLKAIDLDESFEHFQVKGVKMGGAKKLAVYPNPSFGDMISFRTNFSPGESDRVIVSDQLGMEIFNARTNANPNSIRFQNKLRPGVYMLRYVSNDFEQIARVVIKN
jgi:hypothetical protein